MKIKGITLIDVLVGTGLMLIVFLGIFGAYQLGIRVVGQSKNKITATAIANGWLEKIRNLPYLSVGTKEASLPFASGILDSATTTNLNNLEYQVEIQIKFVVDQADGIGAEDPCNWDYKRAQVKVSWPGRFAGEVKLTTDIVPKNKIEEIQVCQAQPGGILSVKVFDALGTMISSPLIEIFNPQTKALVDSASPADGKYDFPLAPSTYKVLVSKSGYSREETFASGDSYQGKTIITPEKPNPIVLEGQVTEISFSIDRLSSFSVETLSSQGQDFFSDFFTDESGISGKSNLVVKNGQVRLAPSSKGHLSSDSNYSRLKLKGDFSTASASPVPILYDWGIPEIIFEPIPISNVTFLLEGQKIVGFDENDAPIYKYSTTSTSDSNGRVNITNLEWDNYTFSVDPATGLDLVSTDPSPQPISLAPNTNLLVKLYLTAQNSFLITVRNIETLEPIFSASVRLYNSSLNYDKTQYTNEKGQTLFIPLENANYNLEVSAPGYIPASTTISVSGDITKILKLQQSE